MHTYSFIAVFAALAANVAAAPKEWFPGKPWGGNKCLTKKYANQLVTDFISLTNGPETYNTALAKELIAVDVEDTSGSVASVINAGKYDLIHLGAFSKSD
jgi:hypothetical protein